MILSLIVVCSHALVLVLHPRGNWNKDAGYNPSFADRCFLPVSCSLLGLGCPVPVERSS